VTYTQRIKQLNSDRTRDGVKSAIAGHGYTQQEAAEELGIPLSSLNKWLNNRQGMSDARVFALAEWVGLEVSVS
jgi:transcriptional regulator with XRE-family HTH domain